MALYSREFPAFDSLYLGGGTPSVLDVRDLLELFESIVEHFAFQAASEMTMEANPESLSYEKLKEASGFGLNRISLGVQSLDDADLKYLGRRHSSAQALRALDICRRAGFSNVSVDLIYGLETQSLKSWKNTLDTILEFRPEHISCYQLSFEKSTPLWKMRQSGRVRSIGEKMEAAFFIWTSRYLQRRGYRHYEVSNFAAHPDFMCRHNLKYWRHVPYLGLGPSAHSLSVKPRGADSGDPIFRRWWNIKSVPDYCRLIWQGKKPVEGSEILSRDQFELEALDLGLRTDEGLAMGLLQNYPQSQRVLSQWEKSGFIRVSEGRVRPTRRGFLVSDSLAVMLGN
jgi:oxygen-independent coproporphyrinogen-3 oxidase